jgi:hypothetical protein
VPKRKGGQKGVETGYGGNPKGGIDVGRGQSDPMGELLRTLVGEDALTFTSLLSRYSTLAQIITLLTVGLGRPYSVKSDLGKNPVGKSAQVKVIITMLKLNRNSILLSTSNIPCPSIALQIP